MKNKIIICLIIVLIIFIISLIAFYPSEEKQHQLSQKEIIEKISDGYIEGISKKELEKLMSQELTTQSIMIGEDSYLSQKPNSSVIKKYNLDNFVDEQKKYLNNLEKIIKNNYYWEFLNEVEENQQIYYIRIQTYNYGVYYQDIETLMSIILSNYQTKNDEEQMVNKYKAKVVAMKLLDSHISEYENKDETKDVVVEFSKNNQDETKNSLAQYLIDLSGYNYNSINEMNENRQTRIQNYITNAINSGQLDQNDFLKI